MLASRSPFAGVALGEGGLQGLKSYSEETKAEQEAQDKAEGMSLARSAKLAQRRVSDTRTAAMNGALKATCEDGRWRITAGAVRAWVEAGGKLDL